ncbi:MAG: NAD-dependent epimerase/dehydratase family protein [Thermoleophilaceae bacterium]|nr:NAD-dependent epimerase/dehydratase family protein [Thermoleophilaceae bacterium]
MASTGLTVAVTGPTGDLGLSIVDALERSRAVKRIVGMARRPFDPAERGWRKTEYRQGDVTDAASVRALVKDAHVVVHLAFAILDASDSTRELNVKGSRRVFEEAVKAGTERICYASSVAAYGFHDDNPDWLTEQIPARGSREHPYSQQKADVEQVLAATLLNRRRTIAYVFRPCIVAGPEARTMLQEIPYFRLGEAMPDLVVRLLGSLPALRPVIPDPGARFQLVHSEDVARAFVAGVRGVGEPGPYNLAAGGTLTFSHLAAALGWYSVPIPKLAVEATAEIATRLPMAPDSIAWLHSVRKPVLMKTDRARRLLKWRPQHTARRTLDEMVRAQREELLA